MRLLRGVLRRLLLLIRSAAVAAVTHSTAAALRAAVPQQFRSSQQREIKNPKACGGPVQPTLRWWGGRANTPSPG
jgi:hypothetical protein